MNPLTGLDSNQSHAFPLSTRPLALGRNSLKTPALFSTDLRVLKYFPLGGAKRLDLVAEFFNLFNRPNVAQINAVFGSNLTPISGFGQPIGGIGARQIQFSLDFEFRRAFEVRVAEAASVVHFCLSLSYVSLPNS